MNKHVTCLLVLSAIFALVSFQQTSAQDVEATELLKTFRAEFVLISPGTEKFPAKFQMGSEDGIKSELPVHDVEFKYSFSIAQYEVTQNVYEAVMGTNPSRWKGVRNGCEQMTWSDAHTFCKKVTLLLRQQKLIEQNEIIRLPSEAEWEYCCRAGTQTKYSFGDDAQLATDVDPQASLLDAYAWHTGNAAGNDPAVGVLKPNAWGLYDMHGYLWEFCADTWHPDYKDAATNGDELVNHEAEQCVIRGGSWRDSCKSLRSSSRRGFPVKSASDAVGIRCVLAKERHHIEQPE